MKLDFTGKILACDCCGRGYYLGEGDEQPPGVYGKILVIEAGGNTYEFYSCSRVPKHVVQAMSNAEQMSLANPDDYEALKNRLLAAGRDVT